MQIARVDEDVEVNQGYLQTSSGTVAWLVNLVILPCQRIVPASAANDAAGE